MRRQAYVAIGILSVLAIGACSHGSSGNGGNMGGAGSRVGGVTNARAGSGAGAAGALVPNARNAPQGPAGHGSTAQGSTKLPLDDGTFKIRIAQLTVAIKGYRNVAAKADAAIAIAERAGGEVDADDRTSGRHATATLQLRVPPEQLQPTLAALSKLGVERSRQLSTTDVTQRVVDVNSRVASAQQSIARLRTLYGSAKKVSDVIAIESEITSREAELEAQQRSLARQTALATINLMLVTAAKHVAPAAPVHKRGGFLGGLERGWHGFTAAAAWVAAAVGTLLPFLVLLLLLGLGVRVLWARLPHGSGPAPTPSE